MQSFVPRDTFALKIQGELCHLKCAQNVSGVSRNGPQAFVVTPIVALRSARITHLKLQ